MARRARLSDLDAICRALPEVELGTSWGDRPTYLVRQKPKPRGFVLERAPRHDAVDPETGEQYDDLLVIRTATAGDKAALVEADGPFFTIDHFRNYHAVLLQRSRIGELDVDELREVLTDAWLAVAPKALAKAFLGGGLDRLDQRGDGVDQRGDGVDRRGDGVDRRGDRREGER